MRFFRLLYAFSFVLVSGCSTAGDGRDVKGVFTPLPGTKTAIVGLPLNQDGTPKESISKFTIYAYPGGRVVFAGPEQFDIYFKNKKSPSGVLRKASSDGVVVVEIPKNIFDLPEFKDEYKRNKSVTFNFGLITGGKDIDPKIIIIRN
jgi:hypothetical protein